MLTTFAVVLGMTGFHQAVFAEEKEATDVKQVILYPTYGYQQGDDWVIPVRAWVKKDSNKIRQLAARGTRKVIRKLAGHERLSVEQESNYMAVVEDFFADSKSREKIQLQFNDDPAQQVFPLINRQGENKTDRNGLLIGDIRLPVEHAQILTDAQSAQNNELLFFVDSEDLRGQGIVRLLPDTGLSVISDIDDTIKFTDIPAGEKAVLNNTFFRQFVAVPCMAAMYQQFPADTAFHYVSGGPWQLYSPIARFLFDQETVFPVGSVHMKNVRTNPFESESYRDLWKLVGGSGSATYEQKSAQIETLLQHFPHRQFILIGDSGEYDPEIFKSIADRYPKQIMEIRIRDVVNATQNNPQRLAGMTIIPATPVDDQRCQ